MDNSAREMKKDSKCEFANTHPVSQTPSIESSLIELYTICPRCGQGKMEYNGLLNLECPVCHFEYGGGYT